jgi:hypothetical protein
MFVLNTEAPPVEGAAFLEPSIDLENTIQKSESIHRVLLRGGTPSPNGDGSKSKEKKSKGIRREQSYSYAYHKREIRAINSHEGKNHGAVEIADIATGKRNLRYQIGRGNQRVLKNASKRSVKDKIFDLQEGKSYDSGKRKKYVSIRHSNPLGRTHGTRTLQLSKQSKKKGKNEPVGHVGNYFSNTNQHSYTYGHRDVQEDSKSNAISPLSGRTSTEQFAWGSSERTGKMVKLNSDVIFE